MFKKRSRAVKPSLRKRDANAAPRDTEDDNDNDDNDAKVEEKLNDSSKPSHLVGRPAEKKELQGEEDEVPHHETITKIAETKKKRKLLNDRHYKLGVDASKLLVSSSDNSRPSPYAEDIGKGPSMGGIDESSAATTMMMVEPKEGIWQKKHREAMEAFIQAKMESTGSSASLESAPPAPTALLSVDALYQEMAATAMHLSGKGPATTDPVAGTHVASNVVEADVGSGGALVSGTGLAEVILPPTERLKTLQETERARAESHRRRGGAAPALPTGPRQQGAVPNRFKATTMGPARVDNMVPPPPAPQQPPPPQSQSFSLAPSGANSVDEDRPGFEAILRHRGRSHHHHHHSTTTSSSSSSSHRAPLRPRDKATDDRAYKQFVTRQREQKF